MDALPISERWIEMNVGDDGEERGGKMTGRGGEGVRRADCGASRDEFVGCVNSAGGDEWPALMRGYMI